MSEMLTMAIGESALSRTRYKRFQYGCKNIEDDKCPGRTNSSTTHENMEKMKEMHINDGRITVREVTLTIPTSFMWSNPKKTPGCMEKQFLAFAPRYYTCSHFIACS